jgi:hypothetical protein
MLNLCKPPTLDLYFLRRRTLRFLFGSQKNGHLEPYAKLKGMRSKSTTFIHPPPPPPPPPFAKKGKYLFSSV